MSAGAEILCCERRWLVRACDCFCFGTAMADGKGSGIAVARTNVNGGH